MPYRYNAITGELDLVMDASSTGGITQIDMDTGSITPVAGVVNLNGENGISTSGSSNNGVVTSVGFVTPYVVSQDSDTDYSTIQDALDAANSAGGGMVWVRPGTYTEDLTFYDNIQISSPSEQSTTIVGTHTPPSSGTLNIDRLTFESATDIFNSAAAGTTAIIMEDCSVVVTNGYTFNLPNFTSSASVAVFNIGPFGTNDGFFNNSAGCQFYVFAAGFGNGTGNTCTVTGVCVISQATVVGCPVEFDTGAAGLATGSQFTNGVTLSGNAAIEFSNCDFSSSTAALTMNSSAANSITQSTVDTANSPCIAGSGAGALTLNDICFLNNDTLSGALTLGGSSTFPTLMTNGQLLIGSTGQPAVANNLSSSGATITITNGPGTINLEAGTTTPTQFDTDSGSATPAANVLDILGGTLLNTAGATNVVTINADDNVVGSVASDSGTATPTSNSFTIAGSGGITTSGSGATVTIDGSAFQQFTWNETTVTGPTSMAVNNGYIANNAATVGFTLPATAAVGDVIRVTGKGAGGWSIAQNAGQTIHFGSSDTTTGAGGSLASTDAQDTVELLCITANTDFNVLSSIGNITVV